MANKEAGGTIYFWALGANASAYQAAARFGHQDVVRLLLERSTDGRSSDRFLLASRPGGGG